MSHKARASLAATGAVRVRKATLASRFTAARAKKGEAMHGMAAVVWVNNWNKHRWTKNVSTRSDRNASVNVTAYACLHLSRTELSTLASLWPGQRTTYELSRNATLKNVVAGIKQLFSENDTHCQLALNARIRHPTSESPRTSGGTMSQGHHG